MSASRFMLFGTALFRTPCTLSPVPPLIFFPKLLSSHSIRFRRYNSSSSVDSITSENPESLSSLNQHQHHPWPEWVTFVDRLKTKGYLIESSPSFSSSAEARDEADASTSDVGVTVATNSVYMNMNLVKDACLSFARDRYDVFKSLSLEDIQTVVEGGCPNLFRKAVNSAKRLRVHVRLDEGDVCGTCNLRGSCDRAYVILKESEAAARTVDLVRIVLFYALDPLVISGGEKPPGRLLVESSARKLLSELIDLSESSPDPPPPKPAPKPAPKSSPKKDPSLNLPNDKLSQDVEMKRGDWMCPKCNFMNFSRNLRCLSCKEDGPKRSDLDDVEMKKGDWTCPECNFMNFSRNLRCLKCKTEGPKRATADTVEMKKGDWNCPQCSFMNFASNRKCLRCRVARPKRQLNPGEWECPSCDYLNYRKNAACLKCNCERPKEETNTEYEEQMWRRPRR
ncbi:zinc finger protein VAR3, chloroplastic [Quillaja saponaria]|uniref:Zinc finger protein VAR3, chloroplastic n=1 Tax=Quillaja saponaria TaxID=32244 RepID=A0AAD7Q5P4_QUISA|nr:zinc finger protein VAR3, chloroplastic [Quillaja saponaria]